MRLACPTRYITYLWPFLSEYHVPSVVKINSQHPLYRLPSNPPSPSHTHTHTHAIHMHNIMHAPWQARYLIGFTTACQQTWNLIHLDTYSLESFANFTYDPSFWMCPIATEWCRWPWVRLHFLCIKSKGATDRIMIGTYAACSLCELRTLWPIALLMN